MSGCEPQTLIGIVQFSDGWRLLARERRWGRFGTRAAAEEAAWRLAGRAQSLGHDVVLIVQERHGELRRLAMG